MFSHLYNFVSLLTPAVAALGCSGESEPPLPSLTPTWSGNPWWPRRRRRDWNPSRCWRCRHTLLLHEAGPCEVFNCGCPDFAERPRTPK